MIYFGLMLLVFVFEYMRPGVYVAPLGALNAILPLGLFTVSVILSDKPSYAEILRDRNSLWLLFYLFLIIISILVTAEVRFEAYTKFEVVLGYIILFFLVVKFTTNLDRLKLLFGTLVLIHVGLIVLNPDLILKPEIRSYIQGVTFLGDGNDFALSICIVLPMCLYLMMEAKQKWKKSIYLVLLILLVFSVIGTSSRGATIGLSAVLLYMWYRSKKKILGVAALAGVVAIVVAFAPQSYFDRLETVKDYETEGSAKGRIDAWAAAVRMAKDHPLLGVGAGHFGMMYSNRYRPPDYEHETMRWLTAHSIYFLTLGELGIPGIIVLAAVILGNIRANSKRLRELEQIKTSRSAIESHSRMLISLNSSMIAFAVAGAFLSAIYYPHIYVLAGLMTVGGFLHRHLIDQAISSESKSPNTEVIGT